MGRLVDVDQLVDANEVARLLGLGHPNTVHQYQRLYADMPKPVVDRGPNRVRLWLRPEIEEWSRGRARSRRPERGASSSEPAERGQGFESP